MPAMMCHWLLGNRVLSKLKDDFEALQLDEKCFLWGCQGPDVLFFHRLMPWMRGENLREFGHRMHEDKPSSLFEGLVSLLKKCGREHYSPILSYSLGMCCHYAFDVTAHPYVLYLEDSMKRNDSRGADYHYHALIESMLDIIMLRHDKQLLVNDIRLHDTLPVSVIASRTIGIVYRNLLSGIYGVDISPKSAAQLLNDMRTAARWLNDTTLLKRPIASKVERFIGKDGMASAYMRPLLEDMDYDYTNVGHEQWYNIYAREEKSCADFFELADTAENYTAELIDFFLRARSQNCDFAAFTGEKTFSYGVVPM